MGKKYWFPNIELYKDKLPESSKSMIKYHEGNIIEIDDEKEIQAILNSIINFEFVKDDEIKTFFDENFPGIRIESVPINLNELRSAFKAIFSDMPDEFFEETNALKLLKKGLNFLFIKKETRFIIVNILNGKLEVKPYYRHPPTIEFYFKMRKLAYDLEEYYGTIVEAQKVIQRSILKEIFYSNDTKKIGRRELSMIEKGINITGKVFVNLEESLDEFLKQIKTHRNFLKRSILELPQDYDEIEKEAIFKINETLEDLKRRRERIDEGKKIIREEIQNKKGVLSNENIAYIIKIIIDYLF